MSKNFLSIFELREVSADFTFVCRAAISQNQVLNEIHKSRVFNLSSQLILYALLGSFRDANERNATKSPDSIPDHILISSIKNTSNEYVTFESTALTFRLPLPCKWLASEGIADRIFSVHSDIWAFDKMKV